MALTKSISAVQPARSSSRMATVSRSVAVGELDPLGAEVDDEAAGRAVERRVVGRDAVGPGGHLDDRGHVVRVLDERQDVVGDVGRDRARRARVVPGGRGG